MYIKNDKENSGWISYIDEETGEHVFEIYHMLNGMQLNAYRIKYDPIRRLYDYTIVYSHKQWASKLIYVV